MRLDWDRIETGGEIEAARRMGVRGAAVDFGGELWIFNGI